MNEPKHTPGPWVSVCSDDCHFHNRTKISNYSVSTEKTRAQLKEEGFDHYRADPHNVANVDIVSCQFWGDMLAEEAKANARLIAAAPEMFDELRDIVDMANMLPNGAANVFLSARDMQSIQKVLNKAKGEIQ